MVPSIGDAGRKLKCDGPLSPILPPPKREVAFIKPHIIPRKIERSRTPLHQLDELFNRGVQL